MITVFKNLYELNEPRHLEISRVLDAIRDEKIKDIVFTIREEKNKSKRNILKKSLPCILFSGVFNERNDKAIEKHSGFICLDFDEFTSNEDLMEFREMMIDDPYSYSVFISPSGDGLKVIVKIPNEIENHRAYFLGLKDYYDSDHFDESCINESRICYMSSDKDIYVNQLSKVFDKKVEKKHQEPLVFNNVASKDEIIEGLYKWWSSRYGIVEGERNRNVYILSMAFNEFGISELEAKSFMSQFAHDGFDHEEIRSCVESAYRKTHLFNTKSFNKNQTFDDYVPEQNSQSSAEKVSVNFNNIYQSSFVDVTKEIEYPPVALSIGTKVMGRKTFPIPFGTYGNFSCIVGPPKTMKTYLKSLLVSRYVGFDSQNYALNIESHRDRDCYVVDIDTEQAEFHAHSAFKRVMSLCRIKNYDHYRPFALRPYEPKERLEFIEWLIYESDLKGNIGLMAIDGLADLVDDFNDLKESQRVIQKVMKWTDDAQFHLTTVLHSNFGSAKAVGHIGSSMLKKAETVCQLSREDDVVRVNFTHTRGFKIDDFSYAINEDGLPYVLSSNYTDFKQFKIEEDDELHDQLPF
jgi:hypothetical protein